MKFFLRKDKRSIIITKNKFDNFNVIYQTEYFTQDLCLLADMSEHLSGIDKKIKEYIEYARSADYQYEQAKADCDKLLTEIQQLHPFLHYKSNLYNNALSWLLEEFTKQYIDKIPERIRSFFNKKEFLLLNKQIQESKTLITKFIQDEKCYLSSSNDKPRKYLGHNTSEIQNTIDILKDKYRLLQLEFERDSFRILHKIFYPALHNCEKINGTIRNDLKKHMQSRLGRLFDESILSEEYLDIYKKYKQCIENEWGKKIIKLLDGSSNIRQHTEQTSGQAVSRPETIAQRIQTVLNGYSDLISFTDDDLTKRLSDVQNSFYFFHKYSYIKNHLEKVISYTGPTLLYDFLYYHPYTKSATLMVEHNVVKQQLETPEKTYKNELMEQKTESYEWRENALKQESDNFNKQTDIYLPDIDFFNVQVYEFETFEQLIYLEIVFLIKEKIYMRKCAYCHKHFLCQDTHLKYCNDCKNQNRDLLSEGFALSEYKKCYNSLSQRISRAKSPEKCSLFRDLRKELQKLKPLAKQCNSGQYSLEDFLQAIDKINSKAKTIAENIK